MSLSCHVQKLQQPSAMGALCTCKHTHLAYPVLGSQLCLLGLLQGSACYDMSCVCASQACNDRVID